MEHKTIDSLFYEELVYESYVRALTEDFSVIDLVNNYDKRGDKQDG